MTAQTQPVLDTSRPFRRREAIAHGIGPRMPARFRRLLHGIYIDAGVKLTPLVLAEAALLNFAPGSWASHASAARVYGLPLPVLPEEHVTVRRRRWRHRRAGVECHFAEDGQVRSIGGVLVSGPEQAFLELGRCCRWWISSWWATR